MATGYNKSGGYSPCKRLGHLAVALLCFTVFSSAQQALTDCSEVGLRAALTEGGSFILDCDDPISLTETLLVTTNTTLAGTSSNLLFTLSADASLTNGFRLFRVSPGVQLTLINLRLTGGLSTAGAAIYNDRGWVTLQNCVVATNRVVGADGANGRRGGDSSFQTGGQGRDGSGGSSAGGGAIYNYQGTTVVNVCVFRGNTVEGGDGGRGGAGGNGYAGGGDGGNGGHGGSARGGAIFNERGTLNVTNAGFYFNHANGGSAGLGGTNGTGPGQTFAGNGGRGGIAAGGAIYNTTQSKSTIYGSTFLENFLISGNSAKAGGARLRAQNGPSGPDALGGAICNYGSNHTLNCTFLGNLAKAGSGGGGGDFILIGGKGGAGGAAWGGGVFNSGRAYLQNCTFSDGFAPGGNNSLGGHGGSADGRAGSSGGTRGAHVGSGAGVFLLANTLLVNPRSSTITYITNTLTIVTNVVAGTSAVSFVCVTNIIRAAGGTNTSISCTGPINIMGSDLVATNFVRFQTNLSVFNRTIGYGRFQDLGGNVSTDRSIRLNTRNGFSIITNDAGLGLILAANDSLFPTLALIAGSPAIDAGSSTNCLPSDQRGVVRPQGARCDTGAFEFGVGPVALTFISKSQVANRGGEIRFSVIAGGERPFTYQWFFGGLPITGATQYHFFLLNVDSTNAGNYMVAVTNTLGGTVSSNVFLGIVVTGEVNFNSECNSNYCTLTWQSASNYVYNIQRLDAPEESWLILEDTGDFLGTGGILSFNDLNGPAVMDIRRYRIVVIGRQ